MKKKKTKEKADKVTWRKELCPLTCTKCGNVLAKPRLKYLPIIYHNDDFELYGDKSKIFNFTDKAVIKHPRKLDDRVFLGDVSCVCGSERIGGYFKKEVRR